MGGRTQKSNRSPSGAPPCRAVMAEPPELKVGTGPGMVVWRLGARTLFFCTQVVLVPLEWRHVLLRYFRVDSCIKFVL